MKVLTVKQAVARVNSGENLKGIVLDEDSIRQVNVRDAMVLSSGGIVIPEQNIYYDDDDIEYDEDILGTERFGRNAQTRRTSIPIYIGTSMPTRLPLHVGQARSHVWSQITSSSAHR